MARLSHKEARILVREAFRRRFSREPTRPEAQCLQAVAWLETQYGSGWHRPANWPQGDPFEPHNMGAIQKASWTGRTFWYTDTHPNSDGSSTPYRIEFRYYESAQAAMDDLARVVYQILDRRRKVLEAASRGDTLGVSRGLHETWYYEGFGKTVEDRIRNHHKALVNACTLQAREIGEQMPDGSDPPGALSPGAPATQRIGATGEGVKLLQIKLGIKADGIFGPKTLAAVKAWQAEHGLSVDGIVGTHTWASLMEVADA